MLNEDLIDRVDSKIEMLVDELENHTLDYPDRSVTFELIYSLEKLANARDILNRNK